MDLQKLKVEKFLGVEFAELAFCKEVNLILGANNAGKSSLRDSLRWLLTGLCRNLRKKNEAALLGHNGAKPRVTGTIDGFELSRTLTSANITEKELAGRFGRPELVDAVMDSFAFLDKSPRDRADLIRTISADPAKIQAVVFGHLQPTGIPNDEAEHFAALAGNDLDEAEAACVERRRGAKRRLEELPKEAPSASVTVDGQAYDLSGVDFAKMQERRKVYSQQRDKVIAEYGAAILDEGAEKLKARMEELDKQLFVLGPVDKSKLQEIIKAIGVAKDEEVRQGEEVAKFRAELGHSKETLVKLGKLSAAKCPTCLQPIDKGALESMIADLAMEADRLTQELELAEKKQTDLQATRLAREVALEKYKKHEAEVADLGLEASAIRARLNDQAGLEAAGKKIDELDGKLALGDQLIRAKQEYDRAIKSHQGREALELEVEAWDEAAKALGAGGPVRAIASSGFDVADVQQSLDVLLPGASLAVDSDWSVTLSGRPEGLFSRSERWRIGCAFAAALSAAAGLGILVLDECDILQGEARSGFMAWLAGQKDRFKRILAFGTRPEAPPPSELPWLEFWFVEDGKVRVL